MRASKPVVLSTLSALVIVLVGFHFFYGVKVQATVQSILIECPLKYPIAVTVHNYTFKRLIRTRLKLEAWRNGTSDNLLKGEWYNFNKIISPFSSGTECFKDAAFEYSNNEPDDGTYHVGDFMKGVIQSDKIAQNTEIVVVETDPVFQ